MRLKMLCVFRGHKWNLLLLLYLCHYLGNVDSRDCSKNDRCSCTFDDGSGTMDLSNLGTQGRPLIQDQPASDGFLYSFNPCYPFEEGTCSNAAGCQQDARGTEILYYNIGDSDQVTFFFDGANVIGTYVSDDGARTSLVTYMCDPSATMPYSVIQGESPPGSPTYSFSITSSECCPKQEPPKTTSGPSPTDDPSIVVTAEISAGTVISIVFFSILFVYLLTGVLFNKLYRKESGRDVIPNVTFWALLPGLIKDGFCFTIAKVRRKEYQAI